MIGFIYEILLYKITSILTTIFIPQEYGFRICVFLNRFYFQNHFLHGSINLHHHCLFYLHGWNFIRSSGLEIPIFWCSRNLCRDFSHWLAYTSSKLHCGWVWIQIFCAFGWIWSTWRQLFGCRCAFSPTLLPSDELILRWRDGCFQAVDQSMDGSGREDGPILVIEFA